MSSPIGDSAAFFSVRQSTDNVPPAAVCRANLSRDYFTNRQDRYLAIHDHAPLADYFFTLLDRLSNLTYRLKGLTSSSGHTNFDIEWEEGDGRASEPTIHPGEFTTQTKETLIKFIDEYTAKHRGEQLSSADITTSGSNRGGYDTTLQPFLQMGPFDIRQETDYVVPELLAEGARQPGTSIDWTSGYFSLRTPYREGLLQCSGPVNIVCAAPEVSQGPLFPRSSRRSC